MDCRVDFLELTVPAVRMYDLLSLLGGGLQRLDRGWRGYTCSALCAGGFGRVGWNDDEERAARMGVHASLSSRALAHLAACDERWVDLGALLRTVRLGLGAHVTRIDLAWDDKSADERGLLDLDRMQAALERGEYTSRWRGGRVVRGWGRAAGGCTLYLGSPASDAALRIYNKRAERIAAGRAEDVDEVGHWVRVELQLRRERAEAAARELSTVWADHRAIMRYLTGVLRGYVEFREPSPTDSNRRRWPIAAWWCAFLGGVAKSRLVVDRLRRTLDDVRDWVARSVAPSLALVEQAVGPEAWAAWLVEETREARARLGPRHFAILAAMGAGRAPALAY